MAIHDFFEDWLVRKTPELALSYLSVKANACIAAFSGESAKDSLIRLRLLQHMQEFNMNLGVRFAISTRCSMGLSKLPKVRS